MRCPYCGQDDSRVVDSREVDASDSVRRRRECTACGRRFTTYERVEEIPILVRKRSGAVEQFQPDKLLRGLLRACAKRAVSPGTLEQIVTDMEAELRGSMMYEVTSEQLGQMVLDRLRSVDLVAYVRFASVYRKFESVEEFQRELARLGKEGDR